MTRALSVSRRGIGVLFLGSFLSCADPVLSDEVNAQGAETSGVDKGEFHRAGQPCVTCHQEGGPASGFPFTVAGTIFAQPKLRSVSRASTCG